MKHRFVLAVALACLLCSTAWADQKTEVTFSGALTNPNDGGSSWSLTGEYLFPVGGPFVIGPSFSIIDSPDSEGEAYGLAGELNTGTEAGLFFGGAIQKLSGDLADVADYQAQARFGTKFGSGSAFFKLYAARTWTRGESGEVSAPDSTDVVAGFGGRW